MGFFKRLFGICDTRPPANEACWSVDNGSLRIELDKAPELAEPGGAIRLEDREKLASRILVFHGDDGEHHALENKCSHAGRRLDPMEGGGDVRCCSIGKTVFDPSGKVESGMGKKDIKAFHVESDGKTLAITL